MIVLLPFAFLSGIVTILSPCILPVLPIVLSGGVGGKGRPAGVITGFILSFSVFTLLLSTIVQALGIAPDALRSVAVVLIVFFGLVMLVPGLRAGFERIASKIAKGGGGRTQAKGFTGGLIVGSSLGLIWTPCVGPIMASVISLAINQSIDGGAVFIILAYSIGTAVPMLAIMLGGRTAMKRIPVLSRNPARVQQVFGVFMILVGITIGFGWDRSFQSTVLQLLPGYGEGLTAFESSEPVRRALDARSGFEGGGGEAGGGTEGGGMTADSTESPRVNFDAVQDNSGLGDYGMAPEIFTDGQWFNIEALGTSAENGAITMKDLRGKVVLIDFWTYSCINCVRTIPHLRSWYERYREDGFVIIGVHSPEFAFERNPDNVKKAMKELGVIWPVVLDNEFEQWRAYNNRYWPAHYFIDAAGRIRYFHFGEGKYDESEEAIRTLLEEAGRLSAPRVEASPEARLQSRTEETYLGYGRARGFASERSLVPNKPALYHLAGKRENGEWALDGTWIISRDYIVPQETGVLELAFRAKDVFLVIEPAGDNGRIQVSIDGNPAQDDGDVRDGVLLPAESRLYHLVEKAEAGEHVLRLKVEGELRLFAFTFG